MSSLNSVEQKACDFIGVSEAYLVKQVSSNGSIKVGVGILVNLGNTRIISLQFFVQQCFKAKSGNRFMTRLNMLTIT